MAEGLRSWLQQRTPGTGNWFNGNTEPSNGNLEVLKGKTAPVQPTQPTAPAPAPAPAGVRADSGAVPTAAAAGLFATAGDKMKAMASTVYDKVKGISARGVGQAAGEAVNSAGAAADAVKAAAGEVKAGYQETRGGPAQRAVPIDGKPHYTAAQVAEAQRLMSDPIERARLAMTEEFNRSAGNVRRVGNAIAGAGKAAAGLGGWLLRKVPGAAQVYEVADTGSRMASPGLTADERKREGIRGGIRMVGQGAGAILGGVGGAGLGALAAGAGAVPGAVAGGAAGTVLGGEAADWISDKILGKRKGLSLMDRLGDTPRPEQSAGAGGGDGTMSGSVGRKDPHIANEDEKRAALLEAAKIQVQLDSLREQSANPIAYTGVRGVATTPGPQFNPSSSGRFDAAFDAMAKLGAYGAAGREAKNTADLGLRQQVANTAAQKSSFDALSKVAELNLKERELRAKEDTNRLARRDADEKRMGERLTRAAAEITGPMKEGGIFSKGETSEQYKARLEQDAAKFRNSIDYSLRGSGVNIDQLTNEQVQGFRDAHKLKTKLEAARSNFGQIMRDYFGNKRFDSADLRSYQPVRAEKANDGGFVIHFANGNTAKVSDLQGGGFNWFGANEPVDADLAAILKPHVDEAKRKAKR